MYFSHSTDPLRYPNSPASDVGMGPPGVTIRLTSGYSSSVAHTAASTTPLFASAQTSWPSSLVAGSGVGSSTLDSILAGIKRSSESFYYPTVLGAHNMIGLSEAWYSTNSLTKRPRYESTSHLPIYPQRPGEKDCAYYMQTRTCKFGESCKFDHPIWVPEGGIPDWKEVPVITSDSFPVRPGEPDCPYFIKTQTCRFGSKCKFNHPRDKLVTPDDSQTASALPDRPSEPPCAFYMKTGICKFGASCKFHHPKDLQIQLAGQANGSGEQTLSNIKNDGITAGAQLVAHLASNVPASILNSKGLPIRPGEVDCPFYLKTGSCKYGATCRYNHPDRTAINPALAAIGAQILGSSADLSFGVVNPAASLYQTIDSRLSHSTVGALTTVYPQRPGQTECEYYMKTGTCMFGERCKFHHPIDRTALSTQGVTLTPAGLPRREGSIMCPYYLKTGTCKFGATCKFDHPPPAEVMTLSSLGTSTNLGEAKDGEEGA